MFRRERFVGIYVSRRYLPTDIYANFLESLNKLDGRSSSPYVRITVLIWALVRSAVPPGGRSLVQNQFRRPDSVHKACRSKSNMPGPRSEAAKDLLRTCVEGGGRAIVTRACHGASSRRQLGDRCLVHGRCEASIGECGTAHGALGASRP